MCAVGVSEAQEIEQRIAAEEAGTMLSNIEVDI